MAVLLAREQREGAQLCVRARGNRLRVESFAEIAKVDQHVHRGFGLHVLDRLGRMGEGTSAKQTAADDTMDERATCT